MPMGITSGMGFRFPGQGTFTLTDTGFVYALDTAYAIQWLIDANSDRFSLSADGNCAGIERAVRADGTSLRELAFVNNFATTGSPGDRQRADRGSCLRLLRRAGCPGFDRLVVHEASSSR
jgi:hypothetical protein